MTVQFQGLYDRQFLLFVEKVIAMETGGKGDGWVNDPADLGGATMWGISSKANPKLAKQIKSRTLSYESAVALYYSSYYLTIPLIKTTDPRLAFIIFDAKVNGATVTIEFIQKWLNTNLRFKLAIDGVYGVHTATICSKLNECEVSSLVSDYKLEAPSLAKEMAARVMATQRRRKIPSYDYTNGFRNRLLSRATFAKEYMHAEKNA